MKRFGYKETHILSGALTIFIATFINFYFSFSGEYWIVLVAFLVSQTTRGTPLRQGLIFCVTISIALFVGSFLSMYVNQITIMYWVLAIIFIVVGCILFIYKPLSQLVFYAYIYFLVILLMTTLKQTPFAAQLHDRLLDVGLGALIGIFTTQLFFPAKLEKEFRQGLVVVIQNIIEYSRSLTDSFVQSHKDDVGLFEKQIILEKNLQTQYPEWVFEMGFNPGLRSGWRFFLIHLERIIETLFSMSYFATLSVENSLLEKIADRVKNTMQKNQNLLEILLLYFEKNEINTPQTDFTSDITELEKALRAVLPSSMELLDLSPEYITMTVFVRDCKDMRLLLLQLVMSIQK